MAVFRVERNTGYTVMSNHHLRNKELTLKAKGLLSQMLSLPEDWDYTLAGPVSYTHLGNVYLILTDGCTLTVNGGIQLEAGNSLTIYGQSEQTGTMGRLIASITEEDASIYDAVIGGNGSDTGGNDGGAVTIHGGFVSATATIFNHNANAGTGNTDGTGDTDGRCV